MRFLAQEDAAEHHVVLAGDTVTVDGAALDVDAPFVPGQRLVEAVIDGDSLSVRVTRGERGWTLTTRGRTHRVRVQPPHIAVLQRYMKEKAAPDLSRFLLCPMPGLLTQLHVGEGDKVEAGQPLAVVEAMKMENILRAERPGTVKAATAKPGDSLAVDAVILEFE